MLQWRTFKKCAIVFFGGHISGSLEFSLVKMPCYPGGPCDVLGGCSIFTRCILSNEKMVII